jgi:hypothetical protein
MGFEKIFLLQLLLLGANHVSAQSYFQQHVNYNIEVKLNDSDRSLDGFEKLVYTNHSPDTLTYIWFHLWPNAYKNDKTAFSEQLLINNRTDFYFSNESEKGYINRLHFKVNGQTASLEDHSLYIDVARLVLPTPLYPDQSIEISTPFHVKLPFNFSRGGYNGNTFQVTQWYPKPAVYDKDGWHPMPYLDQGEFYSEFGDYEVSIIIPNNYVVAATGMLMNEEEKQWLTRRTIFTDTMKSYTTDTSGIGRNSENKTLKTIHFIQKNVHDFAWFADKDFIIRTDTTKLFSGKIVEINTYCTPDGNEKWKNSIEIIKKTLQTRSKFLGEYPYGTVSAVEARMGAAGGMEYPTITSLSTGLFASELESTLEHEIGHNWNYGLLANNERQHPWMDEGVNTYYDNRFQAINQQPQEIAANSNSFFRRRIPIDEANLLYRIIIASKTDQPIETTSEYFSEINYGAIAYHKASLWLKKLEEHMGRDLFDESMKSFYEKWKFKHPSPEDLKMALEAESQQNLDSIFNLLYKRGELEPPGKKIFKFTSFGSFRETNKYTYLFGGPAIGLNQYDKLMIGIFLHNYTLPEPDFHFFIAPMFSTGGKQLTGIGKLGYNVTSYGRVREAEISVSGERFSMDSFTDSTGTKNLFNFNKVTPAIKLTFRNKNPLSHVVKSLQWKTYFIRETGVSFTRDSVRQVDLISYPRTNSVLQQLRFSIVNNRELYPFGIMAVVQQAKDFVRLSIDGNYFFNYPKKGGLNVRFFAGKFIYLGDKTLRKQYRTDRYHLTMTGPKGYEDYTYSNYFYGRNEYDKFSSQQIMIRDGGFKVRADLLAEKIGKSDNWLAAVNFNTDIPDNLNPLQVLPFEIPLKIFFDLGTSAEAWTKDATTGKFLFDAGLQVSVLHDIINIYFPLVYSKVYADYYKSTITDKRFWKNISFSIDIHKINLRKIINRNLH